MFYVNGNKKNFAVILTLLVALLFGGYGLKIKGVAGLADLALNVSAAAAGSAVTVVSLEKVLSAGERRKKQRFRSFFGKSSLDKDFKLICSKRELVNPADGSCFRYPFRERLMFPDHLLANASAPGTDSDNTRSNIPNPKEVKAWLAYDDMLVAARMGRLFGSMGSQVQIALDNDDDNWNESPTIAVGLGFTLHTRKLLASSGLSRNVAIEWTESSPPTDAIKFKGREYSSGDKGEDFAIVARIICDDEMVHFICAGRTAPGTAAAGRYLAEKWEEIFKMYSEHQKSINTESIAVLIQHPPSFDEVRNTRISGIKKKDIVFATDVDLLS